jgi:hypothetical protein
MLEDTTPWFVQNELAQGLVIVNPAGLLPNTITRRWGHATDDDVSHFTFSVTRNDMDDLRRSHLIHLLFNSIHKPPASFKFKSSLCVLPVTVEPFQFSPTEPVAYELSQKG